MVSVQLSYSDTVNETKQEPKRVTPQLAAWLTKARQLKTVHKVRVKQPVRKHGAL